VESLYTGREEEFVFFVIILVAGNLIADFISTYIGKRKGKK
tara:strand:- start:562 stop:684 length:123 start_codon:yes stop_codon:yes gene_type:complete